jgi:Na+-translocating ferredoxin:NAD+ oxidoreductase RnfD subunit
LFVSATFAMFTLVIMHFKRQGKKGCGLPEVVRHTAPEYYSARIFSNGWSLELGWVGVVVCVLTSGLWLLLSKIMRYNPLVSLLSS